MANQNFKSNKSVSKSNTASVNIEQWAIDSRLKNVVEFWGLSPDTTHEQILNLFSPATMDTDPATGEVLSILPFLGEKIAEFDALVASLGLDKVRVPKLALTHIPAGIVVEKQGEEGKGSLAINMRPYKFSGEKGMLSLEDLLAKDANWFTKNAQFSFDGTGFRPTMFDPTRSAGYTKSSSLLASLKIEQVKLQRGFVTTKSYTFWNLNVHPLFMGANNDRMNSELRNQFITALEWVEKGLVALNECYMDAQNSILRAIPKAERPELVFPKFADFPRIAGNTSNLSVCADNSPEMAIFSAKGEHGITLPVFNEVYSQLASMKPTKAVGTGTTTKSNPTKSKVSKPKTAKGDSFSFSGAYTEKGSK